VARRIRVADAVRELPEAPWMTGGSEPEGGCGRAEYASVFLGELCQRVCQEEMACYRAFDLW
jgi:hypothetical protein